MPNCECLLRCPFFNDKMARMPTIAGFYKKQLCQGKFSACARYMIFRTKKPVPGDLYPDQVERAKALLATG